MMMGLAAAKAKQQVKIHKARQVGIFGMGDLWFGECSLTRPIMTLLENVVDRDPPFIAMTGQDGLCKICFAKELRAAREGQI